MSKTSKKRPSATAATTVSKAKPSLRNVDNPKHEKADAGSKQSRVISMLQSPNGTTIAAMMTTTGWQQHSVRGFLAGVIRKRLNLTLDSQKVDGNRIYRIAAGVSGKSIRGQSKRPSR